MHWAGLRVVQELLSDWTAVVPPGRRAVVRGFRGGVSTLGCASLQTDEAQMASFHERVSLLHSNGLA